MTGDIINKVAQSGIITLNPEKFYPGEEIVEIDLKNWLFQGLLLREKEFRQQLKEHDWQQYKGKITTVFCSTDAIVPLWAFMLVSSYLQGISSAIYPGRKEDALFMEMKRIIDTLDIAEFEGQRVVIKGCGERKIPEGIYIHLTSILQPVVRSLMFGEPCSTVPVFKKSKLT